jgi:CBS-domain-containing membrane protein
MLTLRRLTVQDAYLLDLIPSLIVGPDEDFTEVVQRFSERRQTRGIFVADQEKHLLGVITQTDLLDWARVKLGAVLQTPVPNREKTLRMASLMHASTAGQVMHPDSHRAGVKANDSLAYALRLMIELDLHVLPVVDDQKRIVEDLKLDEILARIVEEDVKRRQSGPEETE